MAEMDKETVYAEFVADNYYRNVVDAAIGLGLVEENGVGMFILKGNWSDLDEIRERVSR